MPLPHPRLERERRTLAAMLALYCRAHHRHAGSSRSLCPQCAGLLAYATARLERCPYGGHKPTCARCPIHCYQPAMRAQVRRVMRYAGPRMLWYHPWLALRHLLDGLRRGPTRSRT